MGMLNKVCSWAARHGLVLLPPVAAAQATPAIPLLQRAVRAGHSKAMPCIRMPTSVHALSQGVLALHVPLPGLRGHLMLTKTLEWNIYWWVQRGQLGPAAGGGCDVPGLAHSAAALLPQRCRVQASAGSCGWLGGGVRGPCWLQSATACRCVLDAMHDPRTFRLRPDFLRSPEALRRRFR